MRQATEGVRWRAEREAVATSLVEPREEAVEYVGLTSLHVCANKNGSLRYKIPS